MVAAATLARRQHQQQQARQAARQQQVLLAAAVQRRAEAYQHFYGQRWEVAQQQMQQHHQLLAAVPLQLHLLLVAAVEAFSADGDVYRRYVRYECPLLTVLLCYQQRAAARCLLYQLRVMLRMLSGGVPMEAGKMGWQLLAAVQGAHLPAV